MPMPRPDPVSVRLDITIATADLELLLPFLPDTVLVHALRRAAERRRHPAARGVHFDRTTE